MDIIKEIILAVIGFSSGVVVSGGIFAFIAVIGIVPRFAQRTKTEKYVKLYEDAIVLGGIFGCTNMFLNYHLPFGSVLPIVIAGCIGIFVGCLAMSLAEVLNVIPIFMRRARLTRGLAFFIAATALGKVVGSLMYFFLPRFYT